MQCFGLLCSALPVFLSVLRPCRVTPQSEMRDLEDLARKMKQTLQKKKALSAMPPLLTTESKRFAEL